MRKLVLILLIACLVFGGVMGYLRAQSSQPAAPAETPVPETAEPAAAETPKPEASVAPSGELQMEDLEYDTVDLNRLYSLYSPEKTVLTANGRAENWGDYFYFLSSQVDSVEKLLVSLYANYGAELLWSDVAEGEDTYADLAVKGAEKSLLQLAAIEGFARENGVELTEEDRQALAQQQAEDMAAACGADATDADFAAFLAQRHMSRELYDRLQTADALYDAGFRKLYGEHGEALEDAAALQYLEDNGYLSASHILLLTMDPKTGEKLDEAQTAEKAETARRLAEELQAIEDPEELLRRFGQLKGEYCEDTGKALYPAGYTFTPRTMAAEFEAACKAMAPYEVSDPVESRYGYHIIMRLPPDADALLFSSKSAPITAREAAASAAYGERLQAYLDGMDVEAAEGFEKPDLLAYING